MTTCWLLFSFLQVYFNEYTSLRQHDIDLEKAMLQQGACYREEYARIAVLKDISRSCFKSIPAFSRVGIRRIKSKTKSYIHRDQTCHLQRLSKKLRTSTADWIESSSMRICSTNKKSRPFFSIN